MSKNWDHGANGSQKAGILSGISKKNDRTSQTAGECEYMGQSVPAIRQIDERGLHLPGRRVPSWLKFGFGR